MGPPLEVNMVVELPPPPQWTRKWTPPRSEHGSGPPQKWTWKWTPPEVDPPPPQKRMQKRWWKRTSWEVLLGKRAVCLRKKASLSEIISKTLCDSLSTGHSLISCFDPDLCCISWRMQHRAYITWCVSIVLTIHHLVTTLLRFHFWKIHESAS